MEFGLMLQPVARNVPAAQLFAYNRQLVEKLGTGFTTIWLEDHLQWGEQGALECLTTLSYLAGMFPQYRIGTLVLAQSYRNPALLAKMAANLQLMTQGRVILGLGAGWKEDEYRSYGYPFPDAKTRLEELEEAAIILKRMWSERPATFEGRHYQIHEACCEPLPDPPIPLLIGGGGEKKTLAIAARYADWWNFNSCPIEVYARKVAILKEHCARIGRNPAEIKLSYLSTASVSENPAEVQRSSEKHFIAGSSAEVIRELEQLQELGVTHCMFRFLDPASLERFGQTVVPHFAS
ncbi:MAG TPA: LLM class flavin-dependent oxidoreductase [Ktedonobacteraceae bacterium]|nr:LLM class flavin-dependent oxidoreductase [Ktedonobacteraceae bacterium]